MIITTLKINGYKNLKNIDIILDPKLNIFCGDNAQGKTNLIEAIWICSGCKSFRGTKDKDLVNLDGEIANIDLAFLDIQRQQNISVSIQKSNIKEKNITLNGVKIKQLSKLFGSLKCVIFTPEDLELAKGAPDNRRSYIDLCIAQIKLGYNGVINKYESLIIQRNSLLKNISFGTSKEEELEVWDEQISRLGSYISVLRYNYIKKLDIYAQELYKKLSQDKENLVLSYNSTVFKTLNGRVDFNGEMATEYYNLLKKTIKTDLKIGFTQIGTHRDDLIAKIDGLNSRDYASQGQQRSIALILKLAQAYILKEETNEAPCILLDDVLSELDQSRQNFVLSAIEEMQVLITCCDMKTMLHKDKGKIFITANGTIS